MKKKYVARRRFLRKTNIVVIFLLIFLCTIFVCAKKSSMGDNYAETGARFDQTTKYYTSVSVKAGDSLWSISSGYREMGYSDKADYIREIKDINNITGDTISAGSSIIIPYYEPLYTADASVVP